jgi:phage terminase large subunit
LRAWQAWEAGIKRSLLVWPRRAGKDDVCLNWTAVAAHQRPANYWHCLPLYEQARKAIWEAINPHSGHRRIDEAFPKEIRKRTDNSSMTIEFLNGSIWKVVGSDNPDSLVGAPPAGLVFSEWALSNPSAWGYLSPIVDENDGWAVFITTPRGRNHVHSMLEMARNEPGWFVEHLTVRDTGYPLEKVETQRREYRGIFGHDMADALIDQEFFCSFEAAVLGAYWGRELANAEQEGRITSVEYDPLQPVHTAWDLGLGVNLAVWFFQVMPNGVIHVIDYWQGAHSDSMVQAVAALAAKPYRYGYDWVPHDAKTPETSNGRTRVEMLASLRRMPRVVALHKVDDGINAARVTLGRCYFDQEKCAQGLNALREYRSEWDDEKKVFSNKPRHDWASHAADAFRYLAMAWRELTPDAMPKTDQEKLREAVALMLKPRTYDDIWKQDDDAA